MRVKLQRSGRRRTWQWLSIGVVLVTLLTPGLASGQAFEPNDTSEQATGPLTGGRDYEGSKETENDVDFFYFNTAGQQQLDISVTGLSAECTNFFVGLYDFSGETLLSEAEADFSGSSGPSTDHILYSAPGRRQFVLRAEDGSYSGDEVGCRYRFRIDPPSAVTAESPGVTVALNATEGSDDVQSLALNGEQVAPPSSEGRTFDLGVLPGDARIALDATNSTDAFSWNFTVTNLVGRRLTTLVSEEQAGGDSESPRVGTVRHLVLNPDGRFLENCGELVAPSSCIPVDRDRDGFPVGPDCDDASATVRPDAPEVADNLIDENCDGIVFRKARHSTSVAVKRSSTRSGRYTGRVRSAAPLCVAGRTVKLRRRGSGSRAFGTARTNARGRYTIRRSSRVRGRVYVVAPKTADATTICRTGRSRSLRG